MIVALFEHPEALRAALRHLRAAGIAPLETYTPAPLEDDDTRSPIPAIVLAAGLLGAAASFALQSWSSLVAYPFDIGGRPNFAWPDFIVTAFENAVLLAVMAGFGAFLVINRMPLLFDPVDNAGALRRASSDGWVVAVRSTEAATLDRARALLGTLHPARIEDVRA